MSAIKNALATLEEAAPFADLCKIKVDRLKYDVNRLTSIALSRCTISTKRRNAGELRQIATALEMSAETLREEAARLENGHA